MLDPVAIYLGDFPVYWYGVIITTAFVVGALLACRLARENNIDQEHVLNLMIWIIPAAIIGARLYYVIFSWEFYSQDLLDIFAIRNGGLAIHGGLLGGALAGFFYVRKHKLNFWLLADTFAPSLVLGQAIGRWGNFMNQEAFGSAVSVDFISRFPAFIQNQMFINGQYWHPAFLYESLWNLLVFAILMFKRKQVQFEGQIALLYVVFYSGGRFFIEGLRTDSLMVGPLRTAQVISVLLIALAIWLYTKKKQNKYNPARDEYTKP